MVNTKHGQWVHLLKRDLWLALTKSCQKRWQHLVIGRNILEIVLVHLLVIRRQIIPKKQLPVIIGQPEVINGQPVGIIIDLTIKRWWIHFLPIYRSRKPRDTRYFWTVSGPLPVYIRSTSGQLPAVLFGSDYFIPAGTVSFQSVCHSVRVKEECIMWWNSAKMHDKSARRKVHVISHSTVLKKSSAQNLKFQRRHLIGRNLLYIAL